MAEALGAGPPPNKTAADRSDLNVKFPGVVAVDRKFIAHGHRLLIENARGRYFIRPLRTKVY
jgi:hypothetical protein